MSRLNLPNGDEEDITYVENIINSVGLEFDPEMEILEFHEMKEASECKDEEEQELLELNSFEFLPKHFYTLRAKRKENSVHQNGAQLTWLKVGTRE